MPRELDVLLVLMAARLAEGHAEEGEQGGGEPKKQRLEALAAPSTDRQTAITPAGAAARPAHGHGGGRTDGRSGRVVFVSQLPGEGGSLTAAGGSVCRRLRSECIKTP